MFGLINELCIDIHIKDEHGNIKIIQGQFEGFNKNLNENNYDRQPNEHNFYNSLPMEILISKYDYKSVKTGDNIIQVGTISYADYPYIIIAIQPEGISNKNAQVFRIKAQNKSGIRIGRTL